MSNFPSPKLSATQAQYFSWLITRPVVDYIGVIDHGGEIFDSMGNYNPTSATFKLIYPICAADPIFPYLHTIKNLFEALQKKTIDQNQLDIKTVIRSLADLNVTSIPSEESAGVLIGVCRILLYVHLQSQGDSYNHYSNKPFMYTKRVVSLLVSWLLENKVKFEESEVGFLLDLMVSYQDIFGFSWGKDTHHAINFKVFVEKLLSQHKKTPLSESLRDKLIFIAQTYLSDIKAIRYIEQMFGSQKLSKFDTPNHNHKADQFGPKANQDITILNPEKQKIWSKIIDLGIKYGDKTEPPKAVLKELEICISELGSNEFYTQIQAWLSLIASMPRTAHERYGTTFLTDFDERIVVILLWSCTLTSNQSLVRSISDLTNRCFKKVPEYGFESQKLGNRGLWVLANMPDKSGLLYLLILKYKLNQPQTQKVIDKLLQQLAEASGLTVDQVLNDFIPDFGLQNGVLVKNVGNFEVVLRIERPTKVSISYQDEQKKTLKTLPKSIRGEHKEELNEFKAMQKDIQKMLSAQKIRLDSLYLSSRSLDYQTWKEKFFLHGLIGTLVKNLIWTFEIEGVQTQAIYLDDQMVDTGHTPVVDLEKATQVTLWHPMDNPESLALWQDFVVQHEIEQPFKQAFREIYEQSPDELSTSMYSSRFAAHILKQHQMSALAKGRSWKYSLLGAYDDGRDDEFLKLELPAYNIIASIQVYPPDSQEVDDWTDSGIFKHVHTDKIRFSIGNRDISLDQVPKLVFSEIMRDIDLFVSVTSIGNDPEWFDARNTNTRNYWSSFNYDHLDQVSPLTTSRFAMLERLLPKLTIGQKCCLEPTFLVVEGVRSQYKIHLGSTGIYIMPQNQYLCIVENLNKSSEQVFLPFENDSALSFIISKAILLAFDDKILDCSILKQMPR